MRPDFNEDGAPWKIVTAARESETRLTRAGVARALDVEKSPLYVDLLNAYVHNLFTTPKTHDLRASWDDSERFFEGVWP